MQKGKSIHCIMNLICYKQCPFFVDFVSRISHLLYESQPLLGQRPISRIIINNTILLMARYHHITNYEPRV